METHMNCFLINGHFRNLNWTYHIYPYISSAEFPHGLPALSCREWRQVLVGSRLLQFLLDQLLLLAQCGGCGFCEHPQFPVWLKSVQPASVWAHPAVRALRLLRCCGVTSFDQCVFGAPALKPTTILHLRLPEFRSAVFALGRMGRCHHGAGAHSQLKGLEEDGKTFRTARCKIYPSGLNQALADAVQAHATRVYAEASIAAELPADLLPFYHSDFVETCEVQPDFHSFHAQV